MRARVRSVLEPSRHVSLLAAAAFQVTTVAALLACERDTGETNGLRASGPPARIEAIEAAERPDVLLVTIDTLRADHVSALGYERPTTPHFDAFARGGALFEQAYSVTPTTLPAHAALFTSRFATEVGVTKNGTPLPETATTIAERLADAGYATAGFVSSYVLDRRFGAAQGFQHYDDDFTGADSKLPQGTRWHDEPIEVTFDRRGGDTTDAALHWIAASPQEIPLFVWVHYFDPHQPLMPREPFRSEFASGSMQQLEILADGYDAEVRYVDEQLGRLLAGFGERAPGGRGLAVVTSDHGEGLWDHGWLTHGVNLYEELARVPLAFRWPGRIARPLRVTAPVSLLDLAPTLYSLLGLDAASDGLRGRDLSAVLSAEVEADVNRRIFLQRRSYSRRDRLGHKNVSGPGYGIRWRHWKFVRMEREIGNELFHLELDPGERDNVAGLYPVIYDRMVEDLDAWIEGLDDAVPTAQSLDADALENLETLGYVE